ncbi:MAG: outer membrane protein assembly factor BamC [Thiomicrorhabdus sp.]|nr:MAG: outer membrane protein assembly factor BamC [Thiomicrorhabdus sp.]
MRLYAKTVVLSTSVMALFLAGCSSTSSQLESDKNYRDSQAKVVKNLEMPPNLFNPGKARSSLAQALAQVEKEELAKEDKFDHIPNFKADGLAINSNLSERWLEIDSVNSDEVWSALKRFLKSSGFAIAEERMDIGIIKTEYQERSELVPLAGVGALTKMFNSWRPELANGVFDKYTVRLETDVAASKIRIYFSHSMLYSPDANEERGLSDRWRIKPYNPMMEAEALYQAMVFFGSTREKALAQLQVTEHMHDTVDGEEFKSLSLKANLDQSWSYLQAMVYRADWQMDKVERAHYKMWLKVPDQLKKEQSLLSNLAFWRDSDKQDLPENIILQLTPSEDQSEQSVLSIKAMDSTGTLNAEQRRYIFESLGLLGK